MISIASAATLERDAGRKLLAFTVTLSAGVHATLSPTATRATGLIVNDDGLSRAALAAAFASVDSFNTKARR